ncbi:hypothetical protein [Halomicrobium urmianum]|uniref:hypothetical protein n=1 Tax=Halomicrobium urmianum TaxID=1586233 RepID=UPI001CD9CB75|nr:hypothetical protein [Halomicrobium urmianum]
MMNRSGPAVDAAATYSLRQVVAAAALVSGAAVGAVLAAANPLVALGAAALAVGVRRTRRFASRRRHPECPRRVCVPRTAACPES